MAQVVKIMGMRNAKPTAYKVVVEEQSAKLNPIKVYSD
jgi:hypothetical protein